MPPSIDPKPLLRDLRYQRQNRWYSMKTLLGKQSLWGSKTYPEFWHHVEAWMLCHRATQQLSIMKPLEEHRWARLQWRLLLALRHAFQARPDQAYAFHAKTLEDDFERRLQAAYQAFQAVPHRRSHKALPTLPALWTAP